MKRQNGNRIYPRREFLTAATGLGLAFLGGRGGVKAQTRASDKDIKPGTYDWSLDHGGLTRAYRIHIPPSYTPASPMPLVLALHGGGGRGVSMERLSGLSPIADKAGFIVAYPDALDRLWKDGVKRNKEDTRNIDDVGFIAALIDELAAACSIDRSRVYATGISNGGHMSNRLATELSNRFAAIGPVGATMDAAYAASNLPKRPVSVIYFHGDADPLRYFNGGGQPGGNTLSARAMTEWWVTKNGCSKKPKVESLPDLVDDGTKVKRESYGQGREGSEVVLYIIEGGGHTWPGGWQYYPEERIGKTCRDINASEMMWEFFARHRRSAR